MSKKIQFDIKYRPQIESGEYKVEIGKSDPWPARIACWDLNGNDLIVIVSNPEGREEGLIYTPEGKHKAYAPRIDSDLFLVTPEPELSEFEKAFDKYAFEYIEDKEDDDIECCKRYAAKLQKLAIEKYGPLYTKKEHELAEEAFNKGKAEALKDLQENLANNDIYRVPEWLRVVLVLAKENGKKEALKDLPRWNKHDKLFSEPEYRLDFKITSIDEPYLEIKKGNDYYYIRCSELKKLPGFKED